MSRLPRRRANVRSAALLFVIAALGVTPGNAADPTAGKPSDRSVEASRRLADAQRPARAAAISRKHGANPVSDMPFNKVPSEVLAEAFPTSASMGDPANYVRAERELLEAFSTRDVFQARAQVQESQAVANADGVSTDRFAIAAQDLTGDGLDDALSIEVQFRETDENFEILDTSLTGIRGTDGDIRWTNKIGEGWSGIFDTLVVVSPDLDGDGADDVLVLQLLIDDESWSGNCAIAACVSAEEVSYRWLVRAISGVDGSDLWTRTFDGRATVQEASAGALVAGTFVASVEATNAVVLPFISSDHDADGGTDIILNALDVRELFGYADAWGFVVGGLVFTDNIFVATNAEIASGKTGEPIDSRVAGYQPGGSLMLPAGNAVGDETGDLLWETFTDLNTPISCVSVVVGTCAGMFSEQLQIEMIDGTTRASAWSVVAADPEQGFAFAYPGLGDLNGDGAQDVILLTAADTLSIGALSGADGAGLWAREYDSYDIGFGPLGSIGGAPGMDFLVIEVVYNEDITVDLTRLDGGTGQDLFTTTIAPDGGGFYLFLYEAGDVDGDSVTDIATELYTFSPYASAFAIESGGTGASVFEYNGWRAHIPTDDLNGDGRDDLLTFDLVQHRQSLDVEMTALSMPAGSGAWSRSDRFMSSSYLSIAPGGNMDGDGGNDILTSTFQYVGNQGESRIAGLDGLDGSLSWTAGDSFTPPPPIGTGAIEGTVRDSAANALEQVCVEPYDAAGNPLGMSQTAADGSYVADELNAGEYRILVSDCTYSLFVDEWYNDAPTFAEATPIALADGGTVLGIDATLAQLPPATNDMIADALEMTALPFLDQRSTVEATNEPDEPELCAPIGATVWYRFTATTDGTVAADTFGSDFDTVLSAYGDPPSGSTALACSDDFNNLQSKITFEIFAGQTYYVQAGGFGGEIGKLKLSVDLA